MVEAVEQGRDKTNLSQYAGNAAKVVEEIGGISSIRIDWLQWVSWSVKGISVLFEDSTNKCPRRSRNRN